MLSLSFESCFQGHFTSVIPLNRQVSIRGVHSLFRSYILSLINSFKRNMILDVRSLYRSHYSNLDKSLKHNTNQGFAYYIEVTIRA